MEERISLAIEHAARELGVTVGTVSETDVAALVGRMNASERFADPARVESASLQLTIAWKELGQLPLEGEIVLWCEDGEPGGGVVFPDLAALVRVLCKTISFEFCLTDREGGYLVRRTFVDGLIGFGKAAGWVERVRKDAMEDASRHPFAYRPSRTQSPWLEHTARVRGVTLVRVPEDEIEAIRTRVEARYAGAERSSCIVRDVSGGRSKCTDYKDHFVVDLVRLPLPGQIVFWEDRPSMAGGYRFADAATLIEVLRDAMLRTFYLSDRDGRWVVIWDNVEGALVGVGDAEAWIEVISSSGEGDAD